MPSTAPHDAIAAARELLPIWVVWGNDVLFVVAFLVLSIFGIWAATRFALAPLRREAPETWVERARLSYVGRRVAAIAIVIFPVATITWAATAETHLSPVPRLWLAVPTALVIIALMIAFRSSIETQISGDPMSVADGLRSSATSLIILVPYLSVALVTFAIMPDEFCRTSAILLAITAILSLILAAGPNLWIARLLGLAEPATPHLREIVLRTAARVGIKVSGVYEIDWAVMNALALPFLSAVAFTKKASRGLSDEELESISAHELGHLAEPRRVHLVRLIVAAATAVYFPAIRPIVGSFGITGLLLSFAAYLVVVRLFSSYSRRQERRADAVGAGADAGAASYARALEKLYRVGLVPAVVGSKLISHPELYDRMLAAGVQPEYPRPAPPSSRRLWGGILLMIFPMVLVVVLGLAADNLFVAKADVRNGNLQRLSPILFGHDAWCLHNLGQIEFDAGRHDAAVPLLRAASTLDRLAWEYPANLAAVLSYLGHCAEARGALDEARLRRSADPVANSADDDSLDEFRRGVDDCYDRAHQRPALPEQDAIAAKLSAGRG